PAADLDASDETPGSIFDRLARLVARERAAPGREPLLAASRAFRPFVNAARREQVFERGDDLVAPPLRPGRKELANEVARITVDDQARQPIGFGKYEPARGVRRETPEPPSQRDRALEPRADQRRVDLLGG